MQLSRVKINLVLARKQMTVTQLAEKCGISRNRVNVILNSRTVSPMTAGKLAAALEVDVTEIIEQ